MLIIILVTCVFCIENQLQFYFADVALHIPPGLNRISFRSNDPSLIVPHLYQGDQVFLEFQTYMNMHLVVDNVTYSNDGAPDRINVTLDNLLLGSFETHSKSNWGEHWNDFYGSLQVGKRSPVQPGKHVLSFIVDSSGDCYGVELGTLYITIDMHVDSDNFWKHSGYKFAEQRQECIVKAVDKVEDSPATSTPTTATAGQASITEADMFSAVTSQASTVNISSTTTTVIPSSGTTTISSPGTSTTIVSSSLARKSSISTESSTIPTTTAPRAVTLSTNPSKVISSLPWMLLTKLKNISTSIVSKSASSVPSILFPTTTITIPHKTSIKKTIAVPTSLSASAVHIKQLSYETECLDEINVRIQFIRLDLAGTRIIVSPSKNKLHQQYNDRFYLQGKTTCGLDSWQLGKIDGDNREFQHLVPHDIVTLKLENEKRDVTKFPSKILPFVTPIIKISFNISTEVNLHKATTLFVLGLVNVTKETYIGLQYNTGPMDTEFITFSPTRHIMGWSIPDLRHGENRFFLHFDTSSNTIMFDFLKLEIIPKVQRKKTVILADTDQVRIKGILSLGRSGMTITTNKPPFGNVDKMVIFHKSKEELRYHVVLSVKANGAISIYHSHTYKNQFRSSKRAFTDVSRFLFGRESDQPNDDGHISSLHFNIKTFVFNIVYKDGSILIAQLIPTETNTQLLVKNLYTFDENMKQSHMQTITFESVHVNNYLAAVNEISDGQSTVSVMANLTHLNNRYTYTFRKTSPFNIYLTSETIELLFPLK